LEKLDNKQEFVRNKRNKKDDNDKDPEGPGASKNSSIIEISSQEFAKTTEKSSTKNEKKNNNSKKKEATPFKDGNLMVHSFPKISF
jgi:hypothetical protein